MKHSTIIDHPERAAIERALAIGSPPVRQLSKKYKVSLDTLYRYKKQIPPQLRTAHLGMRLKAGADLETLRLSESESILQNLAQQRARLLVSQDHALEQGDARLVAYLSGEIHRNLKLVGQYLGEFAQHQIKTNVSVLIQPQYLEFRSKLLTALGPYRDAKAAVAKALHEMEAKAAAEKPMMIEGTATEVSANAA
jgi:hypothetical protein